ncbi:prefoldin subunit 3 [Lingula anatina]|uniref:Prefoldin subunit 3 n=1 Tax=Lingula anatina TaxID=7574 RepID=A0A1S3IZS3_LINAN|nr:prefoldin subunit 3 [Lingula anatina]|eukprot:XP_013403501.1 prefoldin subunit 3 [Lingula anatina]
MADKVENVQAEHAGIPKAVFVEDVDAFMKLQENEVPETVLKRLDEQHNKYKFMEYNLMTKRGRLKSQVPDIRSTLDIVKHMISKKDSSETLETRFLLSDQLYAKAKIPPTDKVCLWLGANVMLEYTIDDAEALLTKNLEAATKTLAQVEEDLGFLRDQTTTIEVNMARVYNWDVKRRQALKSATAAPTPTATPSS